ncbi:winged helix-turn-helix domain-containing protein [Erwinia sp. SLM-02]|uniref:winged helix-turn-helix domain-containing protein n=1 Tax=Erwinia sp. SLM-02 TaxID=3020057 RepID=UPI003080AF58
MNYLINGILKYNTCDGTLYLTDGSIDMLSLSRISNELLCLLVENNGRPLSRDDVLNELWGRRGLSSSSNNLNNYVSMLRKTLASLGVVDIITTIPRYGFIFSAEVSEVADGGESDAVSEVVSGYSLKKPKKYNQLHGSATSKMFFFINYKLNLTSIITLMCFVFFVFFIWRQSERWHHYSFEVSQCRIHLLARAGGEKNSGEMHGSIRNYVTQYKFNCGRKADVFYWPEQEGGPDVTGSSEVLAYCGESTGAVCINYGLFKREK